MQSLDLAMLSRYEQARNLTVTLLEKWLVQYKFNDWTTHRSTQSKVGQPVTEAEKEARAEEIAKLLGDNKHWHSHGRMIGIDSLRNVLKLNIEDFSKDVNLRGLIRNYNDLLMEYIRRSQYKIFLHSRIHF